MELVGRNDSVASGVSKLARIGEERRLTSDRAIALRRQRGLPWPPAEPIAD
jgi:hypothetical protein